MAELTLPLDRDCYVAAILAAGTSDHETNPAFVVNRYFELLKEIHKQKGTFALWEKADKAARSG